MVNYEGEWVEMDLDGDRSLKCKYETCEEESTLKTITITVKSGRAKINAENWRQKGLKMGRM